MIYCLTLNPALDYHLSFDHFEQGVLNTPEHAALFAGGKGINVSKVLREFGQPSVCLGFVGGFTGEFICSDLTNRGIQADFIRVTGNTRINIKLNNGGLETEISGTSPRILEGDFQKLLDIIADKLSAGDVLVISGSLPASLRPDTYAKIIQRCPDGVKIFLDTRGEALRQSLSSRVFLVKPNRKELEDWIGTALNTEQELMCAAQKMLNLGVSYVLLSLGDEGAMLVSDEVVFRVKALRGEVVSSVGAGDAMLAGFIHAFSQRVTLEDCLSLATAAGCATAFSEGHCSESMVQQLLTKGVKVEKIPYICPTNI